ALASMAGFGLDPQAANFAQQNYISGNATLARLDKQHTLARQAVINALAGRGLLFSGDTGYQEGQADQTYGNNVYDAQQKVLDYIRGVRTNALNSQLGYQQNFQSSVMGVLQQLLANAQYAA